MQNTENQFDKLLTTSQSISLSKEEKEATKGNIIKFMQEHPFDGNAPKKERPRAMLAGYFGGALAKRLSYSFASLLLLFGLGSGVAFAAHNSLPGDLLYPVKTGVNEKILGWTMVSQEAKADYDIALVRLRLEEIEKVSVQKKLDGKKTATVKNLLDSHIASAKGRIASIKQQKGSNAGVEASATLEASLQAHAKIIGTIIEKETENGAKASGIKDFLPEVKIRANEAVKEREDEAKNTATATETTTKAMVDAELGKTDMDFKDLAALMVYKKQEVSVKTYARAEADLLVANESIARGKVELAAGNYGAAHGLFQDARRVMREIRIYIINEAGLNLDINVNIIK